MSIIDQTSDRERIARVILMVTQGEGVTEEYAWGVQEREVQVELLAQADAVLAVLDLPARDRATARAALDGLIERADLISGGMASDDGRGIWSGVSEWATGYRDTHYPTQETPDAR